jgi:hypothetical protein
MLVTPLPGVSRDDVLKTLRGIGSGVTDAGNVHGAYDRLTAYLEWVTASVRMLEHRVTSADIDRLVMTRGYERLLTVTGSLAGTDTGTQRALNAMLSLEIRQRTEALEQAVTELDAQITRWSGSALFAVADTSVYMEHEQKLEDLDFAPLLPGWTDKTVRVVVPIIIIDELDGLKRSGETLRRWRARHTLKVIEDALASPRFPGLLRNPAPDGTRGGVILDLLFDPPGHVRLPINDDEIIDRALAAQGLAEAPVTLLTFDTGQAARGRRAGLRVHKFPMPAGEEPPDTRGRKAKQRGAAQGGNGSTAATPDAAQ